MWVGCDNESGRVMQEENRLGGEGGGFALIAVARSRRAGS